MIIWVDICFWHWIIQADYAALVKDWFCIFWNFSVIVMFFNNVKYIIFYKSFRRYLCSLLKSMVSNYILNSFGNFLFIKLYFGIILKQAATSKCLPNIWQYFYCWYFSNDLLYCLDLVHTWSSKSFWLQKH